MNEKYYGIKCFSVLPENCHFNRSQVISARYINLFPRLTGHINKYNHNPSFSIRCLIILALIVFIPFTTGCFKDIVSIDLSGIGSKMVINGLVTDTGYNIVAVNRIADYFLNGENPSVPGAKVTFMDNENNTYILDEFKDDPGRYRSREYEGKQGREYRLSVIIEGEEYSAVSKMPDALELDSIWFELEYNRFFKVKCRFTNRTGIKDFCCFAMYNSGYSVFSDFQLYFDREENDGKEITYTFENVGFNLTTT